MQRKDAVNVIKAMKFVTDGSGRVSDKVGMDYFILGPSNVICLDDAKKKYPYDKITKFYPAADGDVKVIKMKMKDGEVIVFKPIHPDELDDVSINTMPAEVSDLNDVFLTLYPEAREKLYYDSLRERVMVNTSLFGMEDKVQPINDLILAYYHDNIERKFDELNFTGSQSPSYAIRDEALVIQAAQTKRNPFLEWVESHRWDGKPRVRTWFKELVGASAPPLIEIGGPNGEKMEAQYIEEVTQAWFMGAIARQHHPAKVEVVPVLISGQGIGKGNSLRYTAGMDDWFIDTNTDIRKPDRFLDSVRGRVIVELSESTQIRGADSEALKAFISQQEDQIRKAYAHNEEIYPRHFVLIASSNLDNIFTDITGNRRYFPFYCDPKKATRNVYLDRCPEGQYEVEQLWAEALILYKEGNGWYVSEEVAQLADVMQQYSAVENPGIEAIEAALDQLHPKVGERTSRQEILQKVFSVFPGAPVPKEFEANYRAWAAGTRCWKKVSTNARINGKVTKGYQRIAPPGEAPQVERLRMVKSKAKSVEKVPAVRAWFKSIVKNKDIRSFDEFMLNGVPPSHIQILLDEGLIFEVDSRNGEPVYKTMFGCDTPDEEWDRFTGATVCTTPKSALDDI